MASIGLSKPYYAKYSNTGSTVTYSGGGLLGKYTELDLQLTDAEANILYGDNGPDESDQQFSGGTAAITTTELLPDVMVDVLGLSEEVIENEAIQTAEPKWLLFDDDQSIPYLGLGGVIKKKVGGAVKWMGFVLTKIQLKNPNMSITTQGETVEWQVPTLNATLLRSDEAKRRWFMLSSLMDSESDAELAVKAFLQIPEA